MTLFRADDKNPINGPHQGGQVVTAGAGPADASAAVIMIHGRGATAQSILGLTKELNSTSLYYLAPQAANRSWYPQSFLSPLEVNQPGVDSAMQVIFDLIAGLGEEGFDKEQIVLLGFSQGACLASEYTARHPARYGGVAALSGGLIGEAVSSANYTGSLDGTPVFLGCSDVDMHIPVERVHETAAVFEELGADLTKKIYPGMGHTVNGDEIEHVKQMVHRACSA